MPRHYNTTDEGDKGVDSRDRNPNTSTKTSATATTTTAAYYDNYYENEYEEDEGDDDLELIELERRLNEEVDEDFFQEPKRFNTIHRVIDVLGLQMIDDATVQSSQYELAKNPAYRNLKEQQQIVEGAIEHMAVIHCADLNGSVIQVGRVARQFSDAVSKVRQLRKQVRDIQDTLGAAAAASAANPNEAIGKGGASAAAAANNSSRPQNAAAMSLRELWLKKLECEAQLALLDKLDIIRAAPARFDQLVTQSPCRIGAGVLTLTQALQTMFSDDVAQVQALHKIMEQLMLRKQKAEEIVWDTLHDILFLRTGNGLGVPNATTTSSSNKQSRAAAAARGGGKRSQADNISLGRSGTGSHSVTSGGDTPRTGKSGTGSKRLPAVMMTTTTSVPGMINPFAGHWSFYVGPDDQENNKDSADDQSVQSAPSVASLFSLQEEEEEQDDLVGGGSTESGEVMAGTTATTTTTASPTASTSLLRNTKRMMIPIPVVEAELDLEADERRCLEEIALLSGGGAAVAVAAPKQSSRRQRQLPRYADPVLALRIIVECLAQLKRLDDVERVLGEGLHNEIRKIVQKEQARTFARLEKKRLPQSIRSLGKTENLEDFRRHLTNMLLAFGNVMLRLSHLAEILRFRISSDRELLQKIPSPSSLMRSVLSSASDAMQREVREFLKACLHETDVSRNEALDNSVRHGSTAYETGLFSLGIVSSSGSKTGAQAMSTATRSNVMEMTTAKFVSTVLFAKTKSKPQVRHALTFRRSVERWTNELDCAKKELASLTGEDKSSPSYNSFTEERAITYLDKVIQNDLLPVLQEEAVNGTVQGLERRDAFDPVLDQNMYARANTNESSDVEMCVACQAIYEYTGPLFMALHRLPHGGEMYLPLVAVLEHVVLTFISRVKQQVGKICNGKSALNALMQEASDASSLSSVFERRKPFRELLRAYAVDDMDSVTGPQEFSQPSSLFPLSPPPSDTAPRQSMDDLKSPMDDVVDEVDDEEAAFQFELSFLKPFLDFSSDSKKVVVCSDEELMRAACLAHSLLKLAGLLENRLKVRSSTGVARPLTSTRALREAIKTIKSNGIKMAKFCRLDMTMQTLIRLSKVCKSSTLAAQDAVRIPSCVNDLGDYMTSASDNLREAAGNTMTAYTFSSLEQYIPFFLMQSVRVIAQGKGIMSKAPLTMNGIEALDRSGSVLYRDLKGATSFENSFWDVELAAASFEQSAGFMAMLEFDMEELVAYYTANREDFAESDFELMFGMTGPRRRGDVGRYHMAKRQMEMQ